MDIMSTTAFADQVILDDMIIETSFFVRDLTAGSKLPFRNRPSAPTSSIDIEADGDVGIGTSSPNAKLDVRGTATASFSGDQFVSELILP